MTAMNEASLRRGIGVALHFVAVLGCSGLSASAAEPVDFTLNFMNNGQTVPVQMRAWIPDGVDRLKGMVLSLPGSGADTRNIVSNGTWTWRLPGMGFGLIGMRDTLGNTDVSYLGATAAEAEANLQMALDYVADNYGHPEITNAPVIANGLSKGGIAANYLSSLVPARTICFVADKGNGGGYWGEYSAEALQMPGLMIGGEWDPIITPMAVYYGYHISRNLGAKTALAMDWRVAHSATNPNLVFAFIDQALRVRYPQNQLPSLTPGTPFPLLNMGSIANPWLGDSNELDDPFSAAGKFVRTNWPEVAPENSYSKDPALASWLPTEAMAMVYRSQNDATFTVTRPLQLTAQNATNGTVRDGAAIDIGLTLSGLTSEHIEIFHDEELIAVLNNGTGLQHIYYTPTENGLQTFIAIAEYSSNGVTSYTSNFLVVGADGVPEPAAGMMILAGIVSLRRRPRVASV